MNYLLYGEEEFLIDLEINKIKNNYDDINISRYDLEENSIKDIIEDANTISLFTDKKLIIVDNSFIFSRVNKKTEDIYQLEEYLNNSNSDVTIIFKNLNEKIDNVKKIVKLIKEKGVIKEFNNNNNISSIVKSMFDGYKISADDINYFTKKVGKNLGILYQEIEKLKAYKYNEKVISKNDIDEIVIEYIDIDIFKFVEDIINKNKKEALLTYNELLKQNEDSLGVLGLLASKIRLMYQASILTSNGYSEEEIASILDNKKYPVHLAIISGYKYKPNVLLDMLEKLADLDIGFKTGLIDKDLGFELFILSL